MKVVLVLEGVAFPRTHDLEFSGPSAAARV
jgi:hypothetical protein